MDSLTIGNPSNSLYGESSLNSVVKIESTNSHSSPVIWFEVKTSGNYPYATRGRFTYLEHSGGGEVTAERLVVVPKDDGAGDVVAVHRVVDARGRTGQPGQTFTSRWSEVWGPTAGSYYGVNAEENNPRQPRIVLPTDQPATDPFTGSTQGHGSVQGVLVNNYQETEPGSHIVDYGCAVASFNGVQHNYGYFDGYYVADAVNNAFRVGKINPPKVGLNLEGVCSEAGVKLGGSKLQWGACYQVLQENGDCLYNPLQGKRGTLYFLDSKGQTELLKVPSVVTQSGNGFQVEVEIAGQTYLLNLQKK